MLIKSGKLTSEILIDVEDAILLQNKIIKIMLCKGNKKYAFLRTGIKNKKLPLHRFLLNCPAEMEVDHINGDSLDNRKSNLRICTHQQNMCNQRVQKRDLPRGVFRKKDKSKLLAQISVNLKTKFLGYFECPVIAHWAYLSARREYYGSFNKLPLKKESFT